MFCAFFVYSKFKLEKCKVQVVLKILEFDAKDIFKKGWDESK